MKQESYLLRLDEQVDWYDRKATFNQRAYKRLQAIAVVLGAMTPLLLALNLTLMPVAPRWDQWLLTLLPIVVSVAATVASSFLTTYKYRDNWLQFRDTCERLRRERALYEAGVAVYGGPDAFIAFVERCEGIMAGENEVWLANLRTATDDAAPA